MIDRKLFSNWLPHQEPVIYRKWVRYLIIAAVFVISLVVTVVPDPRILLLGLGMIAVAVVALFLLRQLALGLVLIVFASFLLPSPFSGNTGAYISPPLLILVLLVALWFIDMIARQRRIDLVRSRTTPAAVLFIVVTIIAFFNGQITYYQFARTAPLSAQVSGLAIFILSISGFFLVGNLVKDVKWLERMTWLFLILGGIYIFGRLTPITERFIRPLFQYGSDASIFWIWLVAITSSQALFNRSLQRRVRIALFILLAATIYVSLVLAYSWKSGWLPAMLGLFVILWIGVPRIRMAGVFAVVVVIALNLVISLRGVVTGGEDYSILTRVAAWQIVLEISKINPVFGLGMSNYFWYTPLLPILGYQGLNYSSHNNYVDLIAQTGIVGLACFLWLAWRIGRLGWDLKDIVPPDFPRA